MVSPKVLQQKLTFRNLTAHSASIQLFIWHLNGNRVGQA
jgi:hypothetical protein